MSARNEISIQSLLKIWFCNDVSGYLIYSLRAWVSCGFSKLLQLTIEFLLTTYRHQIATHLGPHIFSTHSQPYGTKQIQVGKIVVLWLLHPWHPPTQPQLRFTSRNDSAWKSAVAASGVPCESVQTRYHLWLWISVKLRLPHFFCFPSELHHSSSGSPRPWRRREFYCCDLLHSILCDRGSVCRPRWWVTMGVSAHDSIQEDIFMCLLQASIRPCIVHRSPFTVSA